MCGIVGLMQAEGGATAGDPRTIAAAMSDRLVHRGPDAGAVWSDGQGVALGQRRLSILDLSAAGNQPMISQGGRYVIAFNGEIYNHLELRRTLEAQGAAPLWRGHSDTETLLAAFEAWGIEEALKKSVGMFALSLWDREARTLTLARDRLGEKPLYYGWLRGALVFGSELKALRAYPGFDNAIDRRALALYMRHNHVPAPWSIYEGIRKLPPGCYVQFPAETMAHAAGECGRIRTFWSAREAAERGLQNPFRRGEREALDELERRLRESVAGQMIADVPLGAFLSGGIDSSTVVALMQAQSRLPVRTFSIGFHEEEYNEAAHAKAVARHLGTDHTELYVTPDQAMGVIPRLPELYDEPFADSSQIPTFLVAQLARRHVTVALSGDGGDELFGGYNRHLWIDSIWRRSNRLPVVLRKMAAMGCRALSPGSWDRMFSLFDPVLPRTLRQRLPGDKLHKLADVIDSESPEVMYRKLVSHWQNPAEIVIGGEEPSAVPDDPAIGWRGERFAEKMMYLDLITYLPDDILVKLDRAAMGVSLETRIPFLDYRVVEFAWRLPIDLKIRDGKGKWILRQILSRYVPAELIERPKMGFGVPIDKWLRGALREWAESLLDERRLRLEGYFRHEPILTKWREHLSGRRNWQYHLWCVLMFQSWLDRVNAG